MLVTDLVPVVMTDLVTVLMAVLVTVLVIVLVTASAGSSLRRWPKWWPAPGKLA